MIPYSRIEATNLGGSECERLSRFIRLWRVYPPRADCRIYKTKGPFLKFETLNLG